MKPSKSDSKIEGCKNVCVDNVLPKTFVIFFMHVNGYVQDLCIFLV